MTKVVLIMTDGLRPDALAQGYTPHIDQLFRRGAYSYEAQSVMPSITLPCHLSLFHSIPPSRHGILTNTWTPMARPVPGLIEQLSGLHTAFFHSWEPLRNVNTPESLSFSYYYHPPATPYIELDRRVSGSAINYIQADTPDFSFVYFHAIDMAGHDYGWMSDAYLQITREVDALIGELLRVLDEGYTVILLSDHGGHERSHGTDLPADMTIPLVLAGESIKRNYAIQKPISLLDIAPIVARLLGIQPHPQWEGSIPDGIWA